MKRHLKIVIYTLLLCKMSFSQINENIVGKYVGNNLCAFSTFTISISKNSRFTSNYTGHYFTNKIEKGKWKMHGDTLTLIKEKEIWYKFILLDTKLYEVTEDSTSCRFCLIKQ